LMNYGLALMNKGKYGQAEAEYKRAEKFVPSYSYLYINEGVLYGAQHRNSEAEENFKKAVNLEPNDFTSYTFYARFLLDAGRITDAQAQAEKALQLNPGSEMALGLLLKIYNQLGYWDQLGKTAKQYLALIPGDKFAQQCLQASQTHQKVVVEGAAKITKAVTAEDYLNKSLDYYNQGDYNKCIEASGQALKLKPDYADAWNNIGAAYIKLTQWDKAIDACKKALAINPNNTAICFMQKRFTTNLFQDIYYYYIILFSSVPFYQSFYLKLQYLLTYNFYVSAETFFQRNKGFCSLNTFYFL